MAHTDSSPRLRRAGAVRCTWCGELILSTSLPVVAEGFVFHAVCFDSQDGEGACCECGYPLVSPRPERTPSCRCREPEA